MWPYPLKFSIHSPGQEGNVHLDFIWLYPLVKECMKRAFLLLLGHLKKFQNLEIIASIALINVLLENRLANHTNLSDFVWSLPLFKYCYSESHFFC